MSDCAVSELPAFKDSNHANAILGVYGITGSGKSSLAVTACEEAWEVYKKITHWYASDLGGWGTRLLSLIRLGIVHVWYIRNHVDPFKTMERATQGYWPERLVDRETGFADPTVALVAPRQTRYTLVCANGHAVATYHTELQITTAQVQCATCGTLTNAVNALEVRKQIIRPALFKDVGHRVFDSMTQMNEYGLEELRAKSARGDLPVGAKGGSVLGSADAVREGDDFVIGTSSGPQYGFVQDRTNKWISNARAIPDNVLPPIMTFGVESAAGSDETGGVPIYGPKIAGNKRTANVGGWTGNLLYACKEPHNVSPPELDEFGNRKMYHRLWLTNHVDPRDVNATPYVAKHRGEPLGMPPYLEDDGDPAHAWEKCSLRVFYDLLRKQAIEIDKRDRAKFPDAPALQTSAPVEDTVLEVASTPTELTPAVTAAPSRIIRRSRRPGTQDAVGPATPVAVQTPTEQGAAAHEGNDPAPVFPSRPTSVVEHQLRASLAAGSTTTGSRIIRRPRPPVS